jgi:hypothetical protein
MLSIPSVNGFPANQCVTLLTTPEEDPARFLLSTTCYGACVRYGVSQISSSSSSSSNYQIKP